MVEATPTPVRSASHGSRAANPPHNSLVQVAPLSDSYELVAPIQNNFKAKLKTDKSYTSITIYKSNGADPELSRNLTKSITAVERRLDSARSSFQKVHRIINDPKISICLDSQDGQALLEEWHEIELAFENVLKKSGNAAQNGALMISDFLSTIIPYLREDTDIIAVKREELSIYRETLKQGEKCAGVFSSNFHETSNRVLEFQHKWGAHAKESSAYLCSEIDKLHSDINAASASIGETRQNFTSLMAQKWVANVPELQLKSAAAKKGLQGIIKDAKKASKTQRQADAHVFKNTVEIKRKTDDFVVVWDFVLSDLDAIEGQMKVTENSNAAEVFLERVDRLAVQYLHLMEALRMYGVATAKQDKVPTIGLWRKLIGK